MTCSLSLNPADMAPEQTSGTFTLRTVLKALLNSVKQCKDRRPRSHTEHEGHRLQCRSHDLLRPLRPLRSPFEYDSRQVQATVVVHGHSHPLLGNRHDTHGHGPKLCRSLCNEVLPGPVRSRFLSRRHLFGGPMVPSGPYAIPYGIVLLRERC